MTKDVNMQLHIRTVLLYELETCTRRFTPQLLKCSSRWLQRLYSLLWAPRWQLAK